MKIRYNAMPKRRFIGPGVVSFLQKEHIQLSHTYIFDISRFVSPSLPMKRICRITIAESEENDPIALCEAEMDFKCYDVSLKVF